MGMIYDSCQMLDKDGKFLSWCSKERATWYTSRGLATPLSEDRIQLNFTHKGEPKSYNKQRKQRSELCVVCGASTQLTRHHVVPKCYRKLFPSELKSNQSHDVLAVCESCHERYEVHATRLKTSLMRNQRVADLRRRLLRGDTSQVPPLERLWRTHFIHHMKPKHLPSQWSVRGTHAR